VHAAAAKIFSSVEQIVAISDHGVFQFVLCVACADDAFKIKAYNPDAKAASATYLAPTFGGPITKLLPFRCAGSCC
jgi:hypothetical protein